jgi:hypothetical protein
VTRGLRWRRHLSADPVEIDTTLDGSALRGTTTISFTPTVEGLRVLPIQLFHHLRIQSATLERPETGARAAVAVMQEERPGGLFARLFGDELRDADVAVQFNEPLSRGAGVRLTLTYEGRDVLEGNNGRYSVGARDSWYPNLGTFDDLATYDMTFRYSSRNVLVAVGEQLSERTQGGQKVALWRSEAPIRVAGFNYGDYQKTSQDDAAESGISVDVYTHRGTPSGSMAKSAIADALNTARLGKIYFGGLPNRHLSITQQPEMTFGHRGRRSSFCRRHHSRRRPTSRSPTSTRASWTASRNSGTRSRGMRSRISGGGTRLAGRVIVINGCPKASRSLQPGWRWN